MPGVGELSVNVTARTGKAIKNINSFRKSVLRLPSSIGSATKSVLGLSAAFAGFVGVKTGMGALTDSLERIDKLAKTGRKLNIGTEELAGFRLAAEEAGVGADTFDMALQRMVRRVAEAGQGMGEAKNALAELELDASTMSLQTADLQFRAILSSLGRVENQADRLRLAFKLFDSEGAALVNMVQGGSAALDEATASAKAFGLAVSETDAAKIEAANDAFGRIGHSVDGVVNSIAVGLAPMIEVASKEFTAFVSTVRIGSSDVLNALEPVAKTVALIADGLRFWKNAWTAIGMARDIGMATGARMTAAVPITGEVQDFARGLAASAEERLQSTAPGFARDMNRPSYYAQVGGQFERLRSNLQSSTEAQLNEARQTNELLMLQLQEQRRNRAVDETVTF